MLKMIIPSILIECWLVDTSLRLCLGLFQNSAIYHHVMLRDYAEYFVPYRQ